MENINALYKALEQADASGDTNTAQSLADQIRLISSEDTADEPTTDVDSLYSLLENADATGDKAAAQKIADQIRALTPEEPTIEKPVDVTQPPTTKAPVTKSVAPAAPINVMGQQFTPEEYAKYSGMPIAAKPGEQAKGEFSGNFGRGLYNLAADLALAYGKSTGNIEEAEKEAKRLREYGEATYTPSTKTFKEDPIAKIQQLAGGSAPYMIGTIAASMGSAGLGLTGLAGTALPFIASATQFVGSNLQRQMDTGKKLEEAKLSKAVPAALFQASLDILGLKYIPYIKNLFKAGGKEITDEAAKQIIQKSIIKQAGDKLIDTGKGIIVEGSTEAGQQFIERLQAGLSINNPEAMQEYSDSFFGGAILAGGMGLSGNVIEAIASKIPEQKQLEKEKEIEAAPDITTEKRPSRETMIDETWKDLQSKATPTKLNVNLPTITQAGATADQGKLFNVVGGPSVEVGKPIIVSQLDDTTLTSWGLNKNSKAYKKLIGKDMSLPENEAILDEALEAHPGKVDEQAVETYKTLIEEQKAEAPDARLDLGTTTISDEVSGGSKYGTPGGTQGRFGPTTDISGGITGIPETREETSDAPLVTTNQPVVKPAKEIPGAYPVGAYNVVGDAQNIQQIPQTGNLLVTKEEELASAKNREYVPPVDKLTPTSFLDRLNSADTNIRYEARVELLKTIREQRNIERSKQESELLKKEAEANKNLPEDQRIEKQAKNYAAILSSLEDKSTMLIKDLRNPDIIDKSEQIQQARDVISEALTEKQAESIAEKVFKRKPTPEEVEAFNKLQNDLFRYEPKKLGKNKESQFANDKEAYDSMIDAFIEDYSGKREPLLSKQDEDLFHKTTPVESNAWFKDAKLIDKSGAPLKLFHGTTKELNTLKSSKDGSLGAGIYLTPDPEFAGRYAAEEGGNILPVYTNIKNPLIIRTDMGISDPMIEALVKLGVERSKAESIVEKAYEEKGYISKEVQSRAQKQGYDGIVQYKNGQISEVVAFNAAQVKSALEPLLSKTEGSPEGQAIVNSTKPANTLGQALSIIKRQHFNKLNPVQKVLHSMFETLPNVLKGKYKVMGMPKGEYGKYRSILNDTTISPKAGTDSIYHEGTHAATVWAVRRHVTTDKNGRPKAKGNSVVGQQLVDIFDAAEVAAMQEEVTFGDAFKNMEEFVSYAFNDMDFQRFLAKQRSVAPTPAPKSSLWMDLMSAFNRLLGLDISNSLMSDIVSLAPELMTGERPGAVEALGPEVTLYHKSEKEMDERLRKTGTVRPTVEPPKLPFSIPRKVNEFRKAAFSFDMAINKKILNALKAAGVSMEEYAKAFYQLAISQAVRADAMAAAFLHYGNINYNPEKYKFDITKSDISMKGVNDILRKVAKRNKYDLVKMYQYASAAFIARRSQGLIAANKALKAEVLNLLNQGKKQQAEKLLRNNYKLVHMNRAEIQAGLKFFNDIPELNQVYDIWNGVRKKVLNFAVEQQLFTREKADDLLAIMDYVPFYTIAQLEARKGPREFSNGLLDATKSKAFRGSHQEVNNVIDNMERWISYVIRKGINNHYAKNKIDLYKQVIPDDIRPFPEGKRSEFGNTVTIWENGKTSRYEFQGPDGAHMVDGFTGLEPVMIPWLKYWSIPSKFLRLNIVLNPIFSLRQIPMDMFNAMTAAGVKHPYMIPLQVMKEITLTPLFLSNARQELKKTITAGQPDYSKEFNHIDVEASKEAKKLNTVDKLLKAIMSPLTFLSMASDNVIRQAVYAQHMLETGDIALATNAAEEIINFRRTGSSQGIAIVRQIAPFVNANLQGLHINLSTIMSDSINPLTRKQALLRYFTGGATIVGASLLYLSLMADDDEYKKLDPTERDAFFILPNGYKIPMRYDLPTFLFKVIPEHIFNRFIKETEDPTKFWKALKEGAVRALATPSAMPTFAAAPFEGYLNKDFTTNRDIVGQGLQGLEPEQQYSPKNTSELARILAGNTVSPMQVDHFLQKYLATTMGLIAWITNDVIAEQQGRQRPEKTFREKLLEVPNMSGFVTKLEGSRNINDFYELNEEVQRVVKSYPKYKDVSIEEAQKYLDKDNNRELIQLQKTMDRVSNFLSRLREEENRIYKSTTMSAADKKVALDRIVEDRQGALGFKLQIGQEKDRFIQQLRKQGNL
tara:strand:- start:17394 stop:23798 length:6405 start_codon:yes stop_codon:yes gene_type:complete